MNTKTKRSAGPSSDSQIQWFSGGQAALASPAISISRDGRLRFNAALLQVHKLQVYQGVQLGYDPRGPRILFRLVKTTAHPSLNLRTHDGGKVANAKSFFTQHALDLRKYAGRYKPTAVKADGVTPTFAISLRQRT